MPLNGTMHGAIRPYRVTFVCSGNICRSPMGEVILNQLLAASPLAGAAVADSAGLGSWHVGEGADPRTVRVLAAHGYDGSAHVVRQFQAGWFAERDLVLGADRGHLRDLRQLAARARPGQRTPPGAGGASGSAPGMATVDFIRRFDPQAVVAGTLEVDDPWYGSPADFERTYREVEAACRGLAEALPAVLAARSGAMDGREH